MAKPMTPIYPKYATALHPSVAVGRTGAEPVTIPGKSVAVATSALSGRRLKAIVLVDTEQLARNPSAAMSAANKDLELVLADLAANPDKRDG